MDSRLKIDINEDIPLEINISPTTEELFLLVCEQPYLIYITLEQILPRIEHMLRTILAATLNLVLCVQ